ncbi:unnamed protein product [Urochloa decumbens]|uniref:Uncharacterized protein n=1 Tax=Urochloa decumbens TaxID=240449 RepID=A0ABC8Y1R4_9POAL
MEAGGSIRFGQGMAAGPAHLGGGAAAAAPHQVMPGAGMIPSGMSSFLLGSGSMPPFAGGNMVQPGGGYLAPAGYGSVVPNLLHAAWDGGAGGQQQQQQPGGAAGNGGILMRPAPPHRGPWTEEEDATLKAMVDVYGERKWAVVSKHLPGRIGKQCRERWTNHLRPSIDKAKTSWTEADDELLITAHKVFGNRWSLIAKELDGRSENSVKNHWNATKRSLKAKRRLKKKKNAEAPPGQQWSVLEQYIRSISPEGGAAAATVAGDDSAAPAAASDSPPSSYNTGYGGEVVSPPAPAVAAPPPPAGFDPAAAMGLYLNNGGGDNYYSSSAAAANHLGAMNINPEMAPPSYLGLDLNAYYYYGGAALQAAPPMMGQGLDHQQQAAASSYANNNNLITYPFVDNLAWNNNPAPPVYADAAYASNNANAASSGHYPYYYYGDVGAGPSGAAGGGANAADDVDVVQMASREFQMTPSEDEVTLNLAGFM